MKFKVCSRRIAQAYSEEAEMRKSRSISLMALGHPGIYRGHNISCNRGISNR